MIVDAKPILRILCFQMPNVADSLGKLLTLLKVQQEIYPSLYSLQGKLDLLVSQVRFS